MVTLLEHALQARSFITPPLAGVRAGRAYYMHDIGRADCAAAPHPTLSAQIHQADGERMAIDSAWQ
jgi:hypothetical protein